MASGKSPTRRLRTTLSVEVLAAQAFAWRHHRPASIAGTCPQNEKKFMCGNPAFHDQRAERAKHAQLLQSGCEYGV
jgi:hypothetical protein